MPLLHRPSAPCCQGNDEKLVWVASPLNILRTAASVLIALVATECIPLRWRCPRCRRTYLALGTEIIPGSATGGQRPQGKSP